jgi:hypothetical protein
MKLFHWLILTPILAGATFLTARQMRMGASAQPPPHTEEMAMPATAQDGLRWLKTEFQLSGSDYERIRLLHEGYRPGCEERCREIARVREELFALIRQNNAVTPEIKARLDESARLRTRCKEMMLVHFYEVAAAMPAPAASRYLEWVTRETLLD